MYAVIMAGGRGTRSWPLSRRRLPKQLLRITGDETMVQEAAGRASRLVSEDRILVVTERPYVQEIGRQLPQIPADNVIGEPVGRGTAACIGLAAIRIAEVDPGALMVVLASDHAIGEVDVFVRTLLAAGEAVEGTDKLATIGIVPRRPETGYGYIHFGEEIGEVRGEKVFCVVEFVEKPSLEKAQKFLADGHYLWNSGMFVWRASTILRMIEIYLPDLYRGLRRVRDALGKDEEFEVLEDVYRGLEPITIDYGVMEKAEDVVVLKGEFSWSDIGNWAALDEVLRRDESGNIVLGEHVGLDTRNSIIHSQKKLVATIGLENLVIVETDDALLVCRKDRAQDVRRIVEHLEKEGMDGYL